MSRTVLISGASIAGPALAYWLHRHGMTATVIERAPELRLGGQTVDLRGAGRTVIERMGLEQAARDRVTHEEGLRFVDDRDRVRASFASDALDGDGFVTELELLRGELADLLHQHTREDTRYVFGDEITGLTDTGDGVDVTFRTGPDQRFDLVVLADGFRSRTRDLVFADLASTRSFGLYTAYFTIPRTGSDARWARWHNVPGRRVVLLRPDNQGTTRATLSFLHPEPGLDRLRAPAQQDFLRRHYADAGWETPRVLEAMGDAPDFYFESVGQMRLRRWSRGRIAAVGDAAYCASPLSGMGTSLALAGAYVLAGELSRHPGHREAFRSYETIMRPYVAQAQNVSWLAPRLASPKTRTGIRLLTTAARLAAHPRVSRVTARFANPPADAVDLPGYPDARPATH
ncbi:FAD-binding monooxygenase [Amycolatopsis rubida]|uniref:FAD-binding monooxygenase n=1 Tax=Amycolatopsis rubida TaxID=112413 RepID=A0ABX0BLI4_9PSEU|nr:MULTISPECIES: FAD-dependent monooxygenase [Amycolatopsis]MYW90273.1 FAD-binding monooxygenase [Amycolatopsis rubida]NEC55250.1 FAD-binding monooxygenase [Amycolatopsis rubida]OAP21908.1 6-hydroxynicotinate 3-monooxygenase precursor [Amycolatopsis sp. M39]